MEMLALRALYRLNNIGQGIGDGCVHTSCRRQFPFLIGRPRQPRDIARPHIDVQIAVIWSTKKPPNYGRLIALVIFL